MRTIFRKPGVNFFSHSSPYTAVFSCVCFAGHKLKYDLKFTQIQILKYSPK